MGYTQNVEHQFSIWRLFNKSERPNYHYDFIGHAHFFNYVYWKKSIKAKYTVLVIMIVFIVFQFSGQIHVLIGHTVDMDAYNSQREALLAERNQYSNTSSAGYIDAQNKLDAL